MVELYAKWGGSQRSSYKEIQEMKKNMQKVPTIQKKSAKYHQKEQQDAEKILDMVDEVQDKWPVVTENKVHVPRWKKRREKISF